MSPFKTYLNRNWFVFVTLAAVALLAMPAARAVAAAPERPNFIILFADDLGYGDLGCYGHPTIRTPNLDRMASEGMRFTDFHAAAPVCTPSRAALLTGRLPIRNGMCAETPRVLTAESTSGLPDEELTLAQALKSVGYATACVGKWHLGRPAHFLPTNRGFDSYFGIPYSNDMSPTPLMRNEEVIEEPADQASLTKRYTDECVKFITANREKPFFLYMAHTFPHKPLFASKDFKDTSLRGLYGDVVEELDASVGRIFKTLRDQKLAERTLVLFTSDNGPWLVIGLRGGSAGLLRDGKGSTFEGGMREPCIFWWPGKVPAGSVCREMTSTMDVFPTFLELAGVKVPDDRIYDGRSILPLITGSGPVAPMVFFYYDGPNLQAVRKGPWKAHVITRAAYGPDRPKINKHDPPLLYHLDRDPSERFDVAKENPEVVADLLKEIEQHRAKLKAVPSRLVEPAAAAQPG